MLKVNDLHANYDLSRILHGVTFDVQRGTIAAVLGRNGVGKTTTLKAIAGLATTSRGSVAIGGESITGLPPYKVARAGVAYVPEGRMIFPDLTVLENINVAMRRPPKRWTLPVLFDLFPSLAERSKHRGAELSGGEQQMLAIARALVCDPQVVLLDEPSQGLAPRVVKQLAEVLLMLRNEGVTLLVVEQNLKLAERIADMMFVMVKGRVVYGMPTAKFQEEIEDVRTRYLTL